MQQEEKFILADLRLYWLKDFAYGRDFKPAYQSWALVETGQSGGVFIQMSKNGAPNLKDEFADHMDGTSYGFSIPHECMMQAFKSLSIADPVSSRDHYKNHLFDTLYWLAYERCEGKTTEWFCRKNGEVTDQTVMNWITAGLKFIKNYVAPPETSEPPKVFPGIVPGHHLLSEQVKAA